MNKVEVILWDLYEQWKGEKPSADLDYFERKTFSKIFIHSAYWISDKWIAWAINFSSSATFSSGPKASRLLTHIFAMMIALLLNCSITTSSISKIVALIAETSQEMPVSAFLTAYQVTRQRSIQFLLFSVWADFDHETALLKRPSWLYVTPRASHLFPITTRSMPSTVSSSKFPSMSSMRFSFQPSGIVARFPIFDLIFPLFASVGATPFTFL